MSVRAVVFDLDDTLLRDDRTISPYTVDVLRRTAAAGIHVIPASGRARDSMLPFVDQLGCTSLYIACNGAEVWTSDHQLLMREAIPAALAREVAAFGEAHDCYAQTYAGDSFFYSRRGKWAQSYAESSMLKGVYVGDLAAYINQPTAKLLMMDDAVRIAAMLEEGRRLFGDRLSVTCSKPYFLEFNPLRATKGIALTYCAQRLGFEPAEAIAFGDSLNDLSMLQAAGLGVAMGNAREDVKALIATVCGTNEEDGVAHYIEEHLL